MQIAGDADWRMWKALIHMADPENYPEKPEVSVTTNITAVKGYAVISPDDWDNRDADDSAVSST